jgi:hypothetical protein
MATGTQWATTIDGTPDIGHVRPIQPHGGCPRVTMESGSFSVIGTVTVAGVNTIIIGTATAIAIFAIVTIEAGTATTTTTATRQDVRWRARRDSNPRPIGSKPIALSS